MKKIVISLAAFAAAVSATSASAAQFTFMFNTNSTLFGGAFQTAEGIFATSDTDIERFRQTARAITGISGTIKRAAISGLFAAPGDPTYYYFTSGPTFLDGSGVRFNSGSFQNIAFFHQDNVPATEYRINGNGTISAFGTATSGPLAAAAVPEPATWAMMMLGFGMFGFAMRCRSAGVRVRYA